MTAAIPVRRRRARTSAGVAADRPLVRPPGLSGPDVAWLVPYWDRLDGMVRATEGLSSWVSRQGFSSEVWCIGAISREGAVPFSPDDLRDSSPRAVVATMDALAAWLKHGSPDIPVAAYLHGRGGWHQAQLAGQDLARVSRWFVPSPTSSWEHPPSPGWPAGLERTLPPGFNPRAWQGDAGGPRSGVLAVDPAAHKGGYLLSEMARRVNARWTVVRGAGEPPSGLADLYNVRLLPQQEDLGPLYRSAELTVVCSSSETWCLVAAEAMACGCPVLCWDTPVLRETTCGVALAYLRRGTTPGEWAEEVRWLLARPDHLASVGSLGQRVVREVHCADTALAPLLEWLQGDRQ